MQPEYNDLSDKIGKVELRMTEKLGEVLAEMRGISASLDNIKEMRADVERIKETATKAKDSTDSAHKRADKQETEMESIKASIKPLREANLVERMKSIETTVRWAATTTIGGLIIGAIGALFILARGD